MTGFVLQPPPAAPVATRSTVVDANGEVLRICSWSDAEQQAANLPPAGCTVVAGEPPHGPHYRSLGAWVARPAQPSAAHAWEQTSKTWVDPRTLDQHKADKWEAIKTQRAAVIDAPLVTPYGSFDSDATARSNIADAVLLAQTLAGLGQAVAITFTLADNSVVTLDLTKMVTVGLLLGSKVQTARGTATALRDQIGAATSIATVESITWPVI